MSTRGQAEFAPMVSDAASSGALTDGLHDLRLPARARLSRFWERTRSFWLSLAEMAIIVVWALYFGRIFLNSDATLWPGGNDLPMHTHFHFVYQSLKECGLCALWNGGANGGSPTLADPWSGLVHPLMLIPSLLLPAANAAKVMVVASYAMAGLAQWWTARVMGLSVLPRLWGSLLVVSAGHLAGRMEHAYTLLVLSIAAAALVLPAALDLALTGRRRSAVTLGVVVALVVVTGHGYMQVAAAIVCASALLVFLRDDAGRVRPVWKEFVLAGLIAALLAAVYLVPLAHFAPTFAKLDPPFSGYQSLAYIPLNLVIGDSTFLMSDALGKQVTAGALYANYVGWLPIILALVPLVQARGRRRRLLLFFLVSLGLIFLASATQTLGFGISMTHPMLIAAMAVPLVIALAAWGLDMVLHWPWPELRLALRQRPLWTFTATWLVLLVPLAWSLRSTYTANVDWMRLYQLPSDYQQIAAAARQASTEWFRPSSLDMPWHLVALEQGVKVLLKPEHRFWGWRNRDLPPAYVTATRDPLISPTAQPMATVAGVNLYTEPGNHYASLAHGGTTEPCQAQANEGNIDVRCAATAAGRLRVYENAWSGWQARVDGQPTPLAPGPWLAVDVPAGEHVIEFRYRPWDVPLGLLLSLLGVGLAAYLWWRGDRPLWGRRNA